MILKISSERWLENNNISFQEIEDDFPHLPLGCSIVLEKKNKTYNTWDIKKSYILNVNQLILK
jgi:hypothetical protein